MCSVSFFNYKFIRIQSIIKIIKPIKAMKYQVKLDDFSFKWKYAIIPSLVLRNRSCKFVSKPLIFLDIVQKCDLGKDTIIQICILLMKFGKL